MEFTIRLICILIKFIVWLFYQFSNSCCMHYQAYRNECSPFMCHKHICEYAVRMQACSYDKKSTKVKLVWMAFYIIYGLSDCFGEFFAKKGEVLWNTICWNLFTFNDIGLVRLGPKVQNIKIAKSFRLFWKKKNVFRKSSILERMFSR